MYHGVTHPLQGVNSRRQMLGIKAKDAATALGIRVPSYYRIENGERVCPLPKAITLAHLLECTVEQLSQEPTIEEKIAVLHAQEAKLAAESAPPPPPMTDDELRLASGWEPVYGDYGNIVSWMPPKNLRTASPAPTSDSSVVSTPPAPETAPPAAQPPLMGSNAGYDEHGNMYIDEDDIL